MLLRVAGRLRGVVIAVRAPQAGSWSGAATEVAVPGTALADWRAAAFDADPDGHWFVVRLQPEVRSFSLVIDWQRLLDRGPQ